MRRREEQVVAVFLTRTFDELPIIGGAIQHDLNAEGIGQIIDQGFEALRQPFGAQDWQHSQNETALAGARCMPAGLPRIDWQNPTIVATDLYH